jgi:Raf kinase inhibitor-like YbhB/YbcL family protein
MRGLFAVVALVVLAGCGGGDKLPPAPDVSDELTVTSPAFEDGQAIPVTYTCDGEGTPPPLSWSAPDDLTGVSAWAVVVLDPDAPSGTFTHWVVVDLPLDRTTIDSDVPSGAVQAENSAGSIGYTGPCPPRGTHRYRFLVYGLSGPTGLGDGADPGEALRAVAEKAVVQGELLGTYVRK